MLQIFSALNTMYKVFCGKYVFREELGFRNLRAKVSRTELWWALHPLVLRLVAHKTHRTAGAAVKSRSTIATGGRTGSPGSPVAWSCSWFTWLGGNIMEHPLFHAVLPLASLPNWAGSAFSCVPPRTVLGGAGGTCGEYMSRHFMGLTCLPS